MPFAVFLLLLAVNSVFGLYKLQEEGGNGGKPNLLVVANQAKKDYIYLYQFNRTSFAPSQAALNQFVEGLLVLLNSLKKEPIKFHRIANQLFLGSQSTGAAPFLQFDGEYRDGVENILAFLREKHQNEMEALPKFEHDEQVQQFALDISFKILMKDRSRRAKEGTKVSSVTPPLSNKKKLTKAEKKANSEMAGLDFMLYDQGIREQMLPAVPGQIGSKDVKIGGEKFKVRVLSRQFLEAYFDAANEGGKAREKFVNEFKGNVDGLSDKNWAEFQDGMEKYINGVLHTVLISSKGASSEERLKPLLQQNKYTDGRAYSDIDEAELYNIFLNKLDELKIIKTLEPKKGKKKFLGGENPSIGDMALFSILEQFFNTPLNIPEFKNIFQPTRLNADDKEKLKDPTRRAKYAAYSEEKAKNAVKVLSGFFGIMKERLGLGGEKWEKLMQKPWPLNFEDLSRKKYEAKFEGPYNIETDNLDDLQGLLNKNAPSSTKTMGNVDDEDSNEMLAEVVGKVAAKAREIIGSGSIGKILKKLFKNLNEKELTEMMLAETAAYLCNLGQDKSESDGKKCRKMHEKKLGKRIPEDVQMQTRKVVYGAVVAYNDRLVRDKVARETNRVAGLVRSDPGNLAKYSSTAMVGNEN